MREREREGGGGGGGEASLCLQSVKNNRSKSNCSISSGLVWQLVPWLSEMLESPLCVVLSFIIIIIIMILFLKRFSMLNMLSCTVQCQ